MRTMMMTMKYKAAAVPAPVQQAAAAGASPAHRAVPVRATPTKPMGTSATLHATPHTAQHAPQHTSHARPMTHAARLARRDRVVLEHLPLVKAIAIRVHENLPVHVDLDDLVHAGILGLFDAASKYDPDKQVVFSSYAKHRIKGAMLDSLRQLDWASRDLRRRHKQLEAITYELAALQAEMPNDETIAGKMGVDVERWRQIAIELRMVGLLSSSSRPADDENQ